MTIYYKGIQQSEIELEHPIDEGALIEVMQKEIANIKDLFPDSFKDNVFNVFLNKEESYILYGKRIAVKSVAYLRIKGAIVTVYISSYHYCYPQNVFYDGDLWIKR